MRSAITLDQSRRKQAASREKTYRIWKARQISDNSHTSSEELKSQRVNSNSIARILLDLQPSLQHQIRRRCVVTGRSRGIYRRFRRSRIKIRELALQGELACVRKRTW